jgi:hypothetical protein
MKKILLIALFFISTISFSQTIRFEGVVLESGKTPLEMANIMAVNQATKGMDGWNQVESN